MSASSEVCNFFGCKAAAIGNRGVKEQIVPTMRNLAPRAVVLKTPKIRRLLFYVSIIGIWQRAWESCGRHARTARHGHDPPYLL